MARNYDRLKRAFILATHIDDSSFTSYYLWTCLHCKQHWPLHYTFIHQTSGYNSTQKHTVLCVNGNGNDVQFHI